MFENKNGAGDVQVVEPSLAVKFVLVQWKNFKINLNEVAVLRWIKKMTIPKICNALYKSRSTVQVSIRTLRSCGISLLNLKEFEKNLSRSTILTRTMKKLDVKLGRFGL